MSQNEVKVARQSTIDQWDSYWPMNTSDDFIPDPVSWAKYLGVQGELRGGLHDYKTTLWGAMKRNQDYCSVRLK